MDFAGDVDFLFLDSVHTAVVGDDEVSVLFDDSFRAVSPFDGAVETSSPACGMAAADVAALQIEHKTALTIRKKGVPVGDFAVIGIEPDGAGMTRLILERA